MKTLTQPMLALAVCAGLAAAAPPAAAECMKGPFKVNYPRQQLATRIGAINRRTGCAFQVDPEYLKDRKAAALKGRYTAAQLVAQALKGNGMVARPIAGGFGIGFE